MYGDRRGAATGSAPAQPDAVRCAFPLPARGGLETAVARAGSSMPIARAAAAACLPRSAGGCRSESAYPPRRRARPTGAPDRRSRQALPTGAPDRGSGRGMPRRTARRTLPGDETSGSRRRTLWTPTPATRVPPDPRCTGEVSRSARPMTTGSSRHGSASIRVAGRSGAGPAVPRGVAQNCVGPTRAVQVRPVRGAQWPCAPRSRRAERLRSRRVTWRERGVGPRYAVEVQRGLGFNALARRLALRRVFD